MHIRVYAKSAIFIVLFVGACYCRCLSFTGTAAVSTAAWHALFDMSHLINAKSRRNSKMDTIPGRFVCVYVFKHSSAIFFFRLFATVLRINRSFFFAPFIEVDFCLLLLFSFPSGFLFLFFRKRYSTVDEWGTYARVYSVFVCVWKYSRCNVRVHQLCYPCISIYPSVEDCCTCAHELWPIRRIEYNCIFFLWFLFSLKQIVEFICLNASTEYTIEFRSGRQNQP